MSHGSQIECALDYAYREWRSTNQDQARTGGPFLNFSECDVRVSLLKELDMPMKKHNPAQITPQACKEAEITVQTFYRWRAAFLLRGHFSSGRLPSCERRPELQVFAAERFLL